MSDPFVHGQAGTSSEPPENERREDHFLLAEETSFSIRRILCEVFQDKYRSACSSALYIVTG